MRALPLHAATARCHSTPTSANPEPGSHPTLARTRAGSRLCGAQHPQRRAPPLPARQITKLVIIPVTLAINYYFYSVSTTPKVKISLLILLAGVGVATVTDVQLKLLGLCFGVAAVITTAMFQVSPLVRAPSRPASECVS